MMQWFLVISLLLDVAFKFQDTATVHVKVIDINDNKPEFRPASYSFYTHEGIVNFLDFCCFHVFIR